MSDLLEGWEVPEIDRSPLPEIQGGNAQSVDIFADKNRKKWHALSVDEARCDMKPCIRLTKRGVFFITVWKKSLFGRTLKELKADHDMVSVFSSAIVPVIQGIIGTFLDPSDYAVICAPRRRHLDWNFGHASAKAVADAIGLQFFADSCTARSKMRVGAVFDPVNVPPQKNLIIYDDIVTTGQTLVSMHNLFSGKLGKNCIFFANINNKL